MMPPGIGVSLLFSVSGFLFDFSDSGGQLQGFILLPKTENRKLETPFKP
jgi:hypothetical protein